MKSLATILLIIAVLLLTGDARADTSSIKAECYERSKLLTALASDFGERLDQTRRIGINGLLEAFKSQAEGTWTIIYSTDDKLSYVIATGDGLEASDDEAVPPAVEFAI